MREQSIANGLSKFIRKIYCIDLSAEYMNGLSDELGFQLFGNVRGDLINAFRIGFAKYYRNSSDEFRRVAGDFIVSNSEFENKSIDEIGEEKSEELIDEFKKIIRSIDATI